jgi:tRNA dimethylallyltransferase
VSRSGSPERFPAVAVVGPTAVGKTDLSLRLARELNCEIVSFDSVQVYRGLDIGTAKPTPEEQGRFRHHLIDVVDPDEPFDAADFVRKAGAVIRSMTARGKVPLLVGGTGLYLRSLIKGLAPCPGQDPQLRARFHAFGAEHGTVALHRLLSELDPETATRVHPMDTFRVIRALEVRELTGEPISSWRKRHERSQGHLLPCLKIGLIRPRADLYRRIDLRVDAMLEAGFLEEVRALLDKGYSPCLKSLQSLGYRHMIDFFGRKLSFEEAVRQLKRDTRHYAKRQLTWFRADPEVRWFHPMEFVGHERIWPRVMGA